jgi:hypothetical protein
MTCLMHCVLCAGDKGPSEAAGMLQLTLTSLEPPEVPRQQVGLSPYGAAVAVNSRVASAALIACYLKPGAARSATSASGLAST